MMLFQFQLCPLEAIEPWGGEEPTLHWFGLTDGQHWWQVGSQELFRYSPAILAAWMSEYPDLKITLPYVDYQVVRPWEDLLQALPAILNPVPDDLIQHTKDIEKWQDFRDLAWTLAEERDDESSWDLLDTAFGWWFERSWDSGYLRHSPQLWLWIQGNTFHLRWDNRNVLRDSLPVWAATFGEITMPVAAFIKEVRSFHERLMAAMAERVKAVCSGALRSNIQIDLEMLVKEQQERSTWLDNALMRTDEKSDWEKVRKALNVVEKICYNNTVEGP